MTDLKAESLILMFTPTQITEKEIKNKGERDRKQRRRLSMGKVTIFFCSGGEKNKNSRGPGVENKRQCFSSKRE